MITEKVIYHIIMLLISQARVHFKLKDDERQQLLVAENNVRAINKRKEDDVIAAGERIIKERER